MTSRRPTPRQPQRPGSRPERPGTRPAGRPADHHAGPPQRRGSQAQQRGPAGPVRPGTGDRTGLIALAIVGVVAVVGFVAFASGFFKGSEAQPGLPTIPAGAAVPATATPAGSASATVKTNVGPKPSGCPNAAPAALPKGETRTVTLDTRKGQIAIQVKADLSPLAAGNFVALAECGFYNGVIFHRLVPGFVIQGGDRTGTGTGDPGYKIQDEPVTTAYRRGTVAMARTSAPNSQGAQFFIVLADNNSLAQTNTYAIFGTVVAGMDVVDAIAAMPNTGQPNNAAKDPVAMDTVTVSKP